MSYICNICNKTFTTKQAYNRHINNSNIHDKYKEGMQYYFCNCGKKYLHRSNLYAHKKNCNFINVKPDIEQTEPADNKTLIDILLEERQQFEIERLQFKNEKEELQKQVEIEKLRKTIDTQNIDTQNNLNIQINAFGCENLEHITNAFKIKCLKQIYKSIPEMVIKIHFNTKIPENLNVKIPNKKLPYASIMSADNTWKTVAKKNTITSMVDKSFNLLDDTYEEHKGELSEIKRKNYEKYQEKYLNNDKNLHKQLENDVECLVLDGTR
jgi:uncharacterized Zn-finger protein